MKTHWRLWLGVALGVLAWVLAWGLGVPAPARPLIGWNVGAGAYLAAAWTLFVGAKEAEVRRRAARQDEGPGAILLLVLVAIAASLAGIVAALISVKAETPAVRDLVAALAALTLASSWGVLQSVFLVHYAHRHFQGVEARGEGGGFHFPGDPPATYLDFAYLTVCIGATAQVSDPEVQTTSLRNLITTHAIISFFYNTAVLAVGINLLSGLIGH
ncbi:MAG: DUF1345 domain-containing protein [Caulobacteraceae bacterium]